MSPATFPSCWPTNDWQVASPEEASAAGFGPDATAGLRAYAQASYPQIRAVVIVRHGKIVFEEYWDGSNCHSYNAVYSVTKSVMSALVGIALRDGLLTSLDQRVLDLVPEYDRPDLDPRRRDLAVGHLLTMTSGFEHQHGLTPFPRDTEDLAQFALDRRLTAAPGQTFRYDDISIQLLSVVLGRVTGMNAGAYAQRELFAPIGVWAGEQARFVWDGEHATSSTFHPGAGGRWPDDGLAWKVDRRGHSLAGFGLHLTARDMAKFGYLYLHQGRWDGRQIVPEYFVRASTRSRKFAPATPGPPYGFLWWLHQGGSFRASGLGGQYIEVRPREDLVTAVATRRFWNGPEGLLDRVDWLVG